MLATERKQFLEIVNQVHAYYGRDISEWALSVWWGALKGFDLAAIQDALGRHCVNPDTGQFCPKVADVVRMMQGTSLDGALMAWTKVERCIRTVGPYQTVVFDDPVIHRVVEEMGGWVNLCRVDEDELPFRAKEFENRYRGFASRMQLPEYPAKLLGIAEGHNTQAGLRVDPPVLIGDAAKAKRVLDGGSLNARLAVTKLTDLLPALEHA